MGKVIVPVKIENLADLFEVERGIRATGEVRLVSVTDALVDTGATMLAVPRQMVAQLSLTPLRPRQARTSGGTVTLHTYGTVRLTVQGRECNCDVLEVPDDCPVLIGQVPLELLDFIVDPQGQKLIGNPAHGGEQMVDLY